MLLMPVTNAQAAGFAGGAPDGLGGGRVELLGVHGGTATIRPGARIVHGTISYMVEGTADWRLAQVVGLHLPI